MRRPARSGRSPIGDLTDGDVADMLEAGFTASCDPDCLAGADVIVVCVPTPVTDGQRPDIGAIVAAGAAIAPHLRRGALVVLESTTYPGTTDGPFCVELERSGLRGGEDFALGYSPERIEPGNKRFGLRNTPRVVGGSYRPVCAGRPTSTRTSSTP